MNWIQGVTSQSMLLRWLLVTLGCLLISGLLQLIQRAAVKRLGRRSLTTKTQADDLVVSALSRTNSLLLFIISFSSCVLWMEISTPAERAALVGLRTAFIIQFFLWADGALHFAIEARIQKKGQVKSGGLHLMRSVMRALLFILTVILCLDVFGVNITALVAGLGIGGVAVALALQNILSDLFSSLSIILDKPFEVGDFIAAGPDLGTIERIGLKTTRVKTLSGEQMVFPNSNLLQSRIRNYRRMEERRVAFTIYLEYSMDSARLKQVPMMIRSAVERLRNVRFERSHFCGFAESGYQVDTVYWVTNADYVQHMDLQQSLFLQIVEDLARSRISIGVPTRSFLNKPNNLRPQNGLDPSVQETDGPS